MAERQERFRKGMKVRRTFYGIGGYTEVSEDVVDSVKSGVVRTVKCASGITFDAKTGKEVENFFPGMHQEIVPLDELPKSEPKKSYKKESKKTESTTIGNHDWKIIGSSDHIGGPKVWKCSNCFKTVISENRPSKAGCKK